MTDEQLKLRLQEIKAKRAKAKAKFYKYKEQLDNEVKLIKALLGDDK